MFNPPQLPLAKQSGIHIMAIITEVGSQLLIAADSLGCIVGHSGPCSV